MRLEQLEYLLSLRETGSISRTAEKYLISRQAISKSIKELESELSIDILERSSKGVKLTEAGQKVCLFAEKVLSEKKNLEKDILQYKKLKLPEISGKIKIYAVPRYITASFLGFVEKMNSNFPHLDITLHNATADYIIDKVTFDEQTIGLLTFGYDRRDSADKLSTELIDFLRENKLTYTVLSSQKLYGCVHNKSELANKSVMTLQDIEKYPYCSFSYVFSEDFKSQFTIDSFEQQKNIIKQGKAFGRYTQQEFDTFFSKQYHQMVLEEEPMLLFLAIYQEKSINPAIGNFLDLLAKHVIF